VLPEAVVMAHDLVIVGGGIGGAALGRALAQAGAAVLILERETAFKDRVRGEQMHCWGVAEARALGLHDLLTRTCAHEVRYWSRQVAGTPEAPLRDLVQTSPHRTGSLNFHHPEMQEVVLAAAEAAGATVRRGVRVVGVSPGRPASVRFSQGRGDATASARLVVAADGRDSACRRWAGFEVRRDPGEMVAAGALFAGLRAAEDRVSVFMHPRLGRVTLAVPLGRRRFRTYLAYHRRGGQLGLSGRRATMAYVAASVATGAPRDWYEGAAPMGPLASFDCADRWVPHPYRDGIALVGDAAASNDPSFACGLSLTLRDVRVLRDQLLLRAEPDWDAAGHAYAAEHDRYYDALRRLTGWMRTLFYDPGPEAGALRARALPRLAEDRGRAPDIVGVGPEALSDEDARRRLFGQD
jgi:2-polyprenyl-6-methoxyphenol hydroxylase-like FAD-dependent oxidoreductase